ncbi:MAG: oxidoreductase [Candidatus Melainabacteria bacterium]|nr:oxidoreductase [Candidatus Melainabacteria bacterium]
MTKKIALVTGASAGMGKDFARALLDEGMIVYAAARRLEQMQDLAELGAITVKMDITKEEDIQTLVQQINKDHGAVDVLINNAGFGLYGAVEDVDINDARYQFEVNLFGLARLTQALLPAMREQGSGTIINISSMGGKVYAPFGAWYHATKHALEGWSDCLRLELKDFGINVVIIEPGAIKTEFAEVVAESLYKNSGQGAYAGLLDTFVKAFKKEYGKGGGGSEPKLITDLILKALRSKQPKTRYLAGKYAKQLVFIRKWFGDRLYDQLVMSIIK